MTTYSPKRATDPQVEFLCRLLAERHYNDELPVDEQVMRIRTMHNHKELGATATSRMIERAKNTARREEESALQGGKPALETLTDGFYKVGDRVCKVIHAVHGSGYQYAKYLDPRHGHWYTEHGLLGRVKREGTLLTVEEAARLGKLYGRCMCCGATLTDEESIARGIGPVCARKYF